MGDAPGIASQERVRIVIRAFVQARMSSTRFPGKVLAPLAGRPVIARLLDAPARVLPPGVTTVVTSTDASDDPLVAYLDRLGIPVFRGALDDVFGRFRGALAMFPCDWFVRLCADSPLLDPAVLEQGVRLAAADDLDLVTNVFPRTFPKGMSVEILRSSRFLSIDDSTLGADHREHVTRCYYDHPERFRIRNFESGDPRAADTSMAVDSIEDLRRLELLLAEAPIR